MVRNQRVKVQSGILKCIRRKQNIFYGEEKVNVIVLDRRIIEHRHEYRKKN